ncbi:protein-disulfide reductase DsbD domain-containing protein [Shimia sp. Alg240-R146]|uniref:protein-disulfide reductase DsbD domain-containing protein n=1 Tax=Shimia sp. Alg240-R146 TaxID=2993449 RepID=UPI0022E29BF6|nr:protein-disulfide reductase DsbD domain-containing protein [Shimia sp. Alg240-R146]
MIRTTLMTAVSLCFMATQSLAQSYDQVVQAEVLQGWRNADGTHTAALKISLNPGWKTYWRAPGDAGIPPRITWRGSRNMDDVELSWPTPEVFDQNGMRSVGYSQEVILPVKIAPQNPGKTMTLKAQLEIGVCRDICVPQTLRIKAELPPVGKPDGRIAAALNDQPLSQKDAHVGTVTCRVSPTADGLRLRATIQMPHAGGREVAVIEAGDPHIWVAEATTTRQGNTLIAETEMMHVDETPFILDRSGLRFTVLGAAHAVDIRGCSG